MRIITSRLHSELDRWGLSLNLRPRVSRSHSKKKQLAIAVFDCGPSCRVIQSRPALSISSVNQRVERMLARFSGDRSNPQDPARALLQVIIDSLIYPWDLNFVPERLA